MVMTERSTAVGVFTDRVQAERAIEELHRAGFDDEQIGFVARNGERMVDNVGNSDSRAETVTGAATGAVSGGIIGGIAGAAASLLIPGLGPAIAGGMLAAALGGAVLGAAAGGFAGALATMGVPEEEARYYESQLGAGRVILTVNASGRFQDAAAILRANGAYDAGSYYGQKIAADANLTPEEYAVQATPVEVAQQDAGIVPGFGTYTHNIGPGVEHPRGENVPPGPGSLTHEYPPDAPNSPSDVPPGPGGVTREYPQKTEKDAEDVLPRPEPDIYTPTAPGVSPGPGDPSPVPEEADPDTSEPTQKRLRPTERPGGNNIPQGGTSR